jgi:two-component system, LytTR family, sensor histidine kinase AlgZ
VASIRQNTTPARLPDFCNLGVVLRTLLIANAFCFAAALARRDTLAGLWPEFLNIAAVAQPIILLSLVILCPARAQLEKLDYRAGLAAILLIELLLASLLFWLTHAWLPGFESATLLHFCLFTFGLAGVILYYFDQRARALSPAITEARLQALQARIRPHFLFNSITAVLSLVRHEPRRAERALEDMADLFRVLMADNKELTPLQREVDLCRQYLDLEQLRLGERLHVAWHLEKMPGDALVPPLLLQPLLENAVYHGIEPSSVPGEININIYRNRDQVVMVLRNPYLGGGGNHHAGNKMAMGNIRERLALHFDVEASMKTAITGTTYQVTINLPYRPAAV